jgi:purine-binding chemotaxis protein CheW
MTQKRGETPRHLESIVGLPPSGSEPALGSELLVFRAGAERFALAVAGLEAVIEMPPVQPLPGMPPGMLGVAELRGNLVPVYSPARVLNVAVEQMAAAIIVRTGPVEKHGVSRRVAIGVSGAEGVTAYEPGAWSGIGGPTPQGGLVRGVATWEGQLTTLVDAATFVAACIDTTPVVLR